MGWGFFKRVFGTWTRNDRIVLYIAMSDQEYFRVTGKLQAANIPYYVKSPFTAKRPGGSMFSPNRTQTYEIFVKREVEYQARKAIWGKS